ncbi:hypothetical protein BKA69DRAFT_1039941 [Paraphysoderma sedebokerense]|nr:hypothetical protein BKA69DRAFT_1039941 [Paraphysoderma sedebokerense]
MVLSTDTEPTSPQQQEYNSFHYTTHWALIHRYLEQHSRSYGGKSPALATATIFLSLNHDIARFSSSLIHLFGYYPSEILHNHISHHLHPESAFIAANWRNSFIDIVSHLLLSKSEYQRHHPRNTDSHQTSKSCRNLEIGARGTPLFESYMYFYNLRTKSYERFHVCAYLGGALGANLKDCVNIEECYVVWHLFKVDGQVAEKTESLEESTYDTGYQASFHPHGDKMSSEEQNKVSKVRDTLSLKDLMSTLKLQSTGAHRVETATKFDRESNIDQTDIFNPFSSCAHPPYPTDIRTCSESVDGGNRFAR